MNPIIEKLGDRPKEWLQKVNDRRKELVQRGTEVVADLQELQEKLVEKGQHALQAGQKAVLTFEETVLSRVSDLLDRAHALTGERSAALKRSAEYVGERIKELREQIRAEEAGKEVKRGGCAGRGDRAANRPRLVRRRRKFEPAAVTESVEPRQRRQRHERGGSKEPGASVPGPRRVMTKPPGVSSTRRTSRPLASMSWPRGAAGRFWTRSSVFWRRPRTDHCRVPCLCERASLGDEERVLQVI
jgi:hypothetical protein